MHAGSATNMFNQHCISQNTNVSLSTIRFNFSTFSPFFIKQTSNVWPVSRHRWTNGHLETWTVRGTFGIAVSNSSVHSSTSKTHTGSWMGRILPCLRKRAVLILLTSKDGSVIGAFHWQSAKPAVDTVEVGDDVVHVHLALWRIYIRQKKLWRLFFFIGDPCCVCAKQTVHVRNMSSLLNVSTEQINEAITLSSFPRMLKIWNKCYCFRSPPSHCQTDRNVNFIQMATGIKSL